MKAIWSTFFLVFMLSASLAQNGGMSFKHITTNEGLSQSTVTSILQDDEGFLWFGTQDGLNKYDGKTFKVYKNDPNNAKSLSSNYIHALAKDRDGNIWIGTQEGGLVFFDRQNETFTGYSHNPKDSSSLSHVAVNCIAPEENGNLWIGTYGGGLDYFDIKSKKFKHFKNDPSDDKSFDFISDIHIDKHGNIWIATSFGGLNRFDKASQSFISFKKDPTNEQSISKNDITQIFEDSKGNLWISTDGGGLNLFNPDTENFTRYQHRDNDAHSLGHNDILSLAEDVKGNLWVGTRNGGISIFHPDDKTFTTLKQDKNDERTLNSNSIYSLYKDKDGNMWVGTYSGGINFVSALGEKFKHYKNDKYNSNSLSNNNVLSIMEDHEGTLWIGTDGGGLNIFKRDINEFTHLTHDPKNPKSITSDYVLDIFEDSDHDMWVGNFKGGFNLFNKKDKSFTHFQLDSVELNPYKETIWQIIQDRKGFLWLASYGLSRYNKETKKFTPFLPDPATPGRFSHATVFALLEDRNGNIWAGTPGGGLNLYHEKTNTFTCFKNDNKDSTSISSSLVNAIAQDTNGNLWIGTNNGLNLFHPETQTFSAYHEKDGLPNEIVYGIQEDNNGNLWISTNKGLSKFNPKTKKFRNYDISDGLQGNSFNRMSFLKNKKGELFFGGLNGFNVFHPDSIVDNPVVPPVYITNFEIFNKPVTVYQKDSPLTQSIDKTKEITLSYEQTVFSFDFAALNYNSPDKNQYAYKMEGFDRDWIYTNSNKAIYTNLSPGKYVFRVKASNNDGIWNNNGTALKIIITPPFWKTWTFKILLAVIIVGCIYSFFRIRMSVINRQKVALEKEVKKQTAEVIQQKEALEIEREEAEKARQDAEQANQAKSIFLATMSHEIRTPMNGVLGMASLLAETNQTKEQQEYTDTIQNSGQALLTIINDILDFSKIDSGNLELDNQSFDLRLCMEEVMDVFSAKASEMGLDLLYEIDYKIPTYVIGDKHRLRQILINLISNAVKFTQRGEIFVGVDLIRSESNNLEIGFHVRDTGIGISPDKISRLFKAFSQVDSSTNRKYGGTGLGLVISQRLVELMGGKITVVSQPEVGTTFSFSINTEASGEVERYVPNILVGSEGKNILLVDENATNLNVLKTQLEQWKLIPTLAFSGEQAIEILDQQANFDLAIIDMQMPNMNGLQLSKLIKIKFPHLPIILISTIGDESKKKDPELFSAVIAKPVKQQQLAQVIQASLRVERNLQSLVEEKTKYVLSVDFATKYPLRILLAEDNPVNQKLAIRILNKLGYLDIEVAQNGVEVIEKFKTQFYQVILMDMQMPEMDGLEATKLVRLRPGQQPIIIAMTANAMQGDRDLCLQVGMNEYLTKPIKLEALMNALEKAAEIFRVLEKQDKIKAS